MTPQSPFMVLAPVDPNRERELRGLLESMNDAPGRVNANNSLIPFGEFDGLHVARLLILDDTTAEDSRVYGLPPRKNSLYFAFLGDVDGEADAFLDDVAERAAAGLRRLFSCCEGFTPDTDLRAWLRRHRNPAVANYVNWRGRSVRQIREEANLRAALDDHIARDPDTFRRLPPRELHAALRSFVDAEAAAGRLTLSAPAPTPLAWWWRDKLHLIGIPLLVVVVSPLLLLAAPFYIAWLRRLERTDPEICFSVAQAHSEALSHLEDHDVSNQFSAMGSLKPGLIRLLTVIGVLKTVDYAARHVVRRGRLGRIRSIHFARWAFVGGTQRMAFFSNYDGNVESYMDDFINKAGFGLNAVFGNGIGYPRTRWLVQDGCGDERKYKEYLRRHTLATHVWYKAYPGLTAVDLERNTRLREGLAAPSLSEDAAREWLALL
jgi:hypothetical protein